MALTRFTERMRRATQAKATHVAASERRTGALPASPVLPPHVTDQRRTSPEGACTSNALHQRCIPTGPITAVAFHSASTVVAALLSGLDRACGCYFPSASVPTTVKEFHRIGVQLGDSARLAAVVLHTLPCTNRAISRRRRPSGSRLRSTAQRLGLDAAVTYHPRSSCVGKDLPTCPAASEPASRGMLLVSDRWRKG